MPIEISFVPEDELILVTNRGRITFREIRAASLEGRKLATEHGVFRFLADCRQVISAIGAHEIYDLPDMYAAAGVPRSTMIAVVAPAGRPNNDDYRFFETVCRNNGYPYVEIFDSLEAAKNWLAHNRPPSASPQ